MKTTTIRCPLNEAAGMSTNQAGLLSPDGALLFTELEQCVIATAQLLQKNGIHPGERVGIALPGKWEQIILFWALLRIGATFAPLDERALAVMDLEALAQHLGIRHIIGTTPHPPKTLPLQWLPVHQLVGFTAPLKRHARPRIDLNAEAILLWTRTHQPEPVTHTLADCYYAALAGNTTLPLRSNDRWLLRPLTTFQGIDILLRTCIAGATAVMDPEPLPTASRLAELQITHITLDTTQIPHLIDQTPPPPARHPLKAILINGTTHPDQRRALHTRKILPVNTLGDQTTGYFALLDPNHTLQPLQFIRLRLDENHHVAVSRRETPWRTTTWLARQTEDGLHLSPSQTPATSTDR